MIDKNNSEIDLTKIANKSHELERENFRATIKKDKFWAKIGLLLVIICAISPFFSAPRVESAHEKEMASKMMANIQSFGLTRFWLWFFCVLLSCGWVFTALAWRYKKSSLFWEENPLIPFLYGCLWLVVLGFAVLTVLGLAMVNLPPGSY